MRMIALGMRGLGFLSLSGIFLELTRRAASMSVRDAFMTSIADLRTFFFFFFFAHDGRPGFRSNFFPFFVLLMATKEGVLISATRVGELIPVRA